MKLAKYYEHVLDPTFRTFRAAFFELKNALKAFGCRIFWTFAF